MDCFDTWAWVRKVETHARGMTGGELEGLVDYRPDGWTTLRPVLVKTLVIFL